VIGGLLQRVFRSRKTEAPPLDYETAKTLAASPAVSDRQRAAENGGTRPEILYYLAADKTPEVRAAVAANEATPVQADLILTRDADDRVREDLARKIARLTPGLSAEQHERLRRMTYEALEILARDQVRKVRQVIAETLRDVASAPPEIIRLLAQDSEIEVASPVLQYSPVLTDADLMEIIGSSPIPGALGAIARRDGLPEPISDAIGASSDIDAIAALLSNPSAQIREETLDQLVDRAREVKIWHLPLVRRPKLSAQAGIALAQFVATNLLAILKDRRDLDPVATREISRLVMRRLAEEAPDTASRPEPLAGIPKAQSKPTNEQLERARKLKETGKLDETAVLHALGSDRTFARACLAVLAELPVEAVEKMLGAHSAKGVVALAWKAGLGARAAVRVQIQLAQIPPGTALQPRPDGTYALGEDAMRWQLDFFAGMG